MPELAVTEYCSRCGLRVSVCPWRIIERPGDGMPGYTAGGSEWCNLCGHCEAVCPAGALALHAPQLVRADHADAIATMEPERLGAYLIMRRSIRSYRKEPVERSIIGQILDICRFAPTGRNRQDVRWLVIHDTEEVRRLTSMAIDWMRQSAAGAELSSRFDLPAMVRAWDEGRDPLCHHAPHLVIAYAHAENPVARTNAVIALAHLEIVAPSFGVGTCWGGILLFALNNHDPLREALGLPDGHLPVHAMMLGHPQIRYQRPPKRKPADILWR